MKRIDCLKYSGDELNNRMGVTRKELINLKIEQYMNNGEKIGCKNELQGPVGSTRNTLYSRHCSHRRIVERWFSKCI